jgi:hypothetical protein
MAIDDRVRRPSPDASADAVDGSSTCITPEATAALALDALRTSLGSEARSGRFQQVVAAAVSTVRRAAGAGRRIVRGSLVRLRELGPGRRDRGRRAGSRGAVRSSAAPSTAERAVRRVEALPIGVRLIHIGPPKTGTTALQAAFDRSREDALDQGVRYAGRRRHSRGAVLAVTGARAQGSDLRRSMQEWRRIVDEVRGAPEARVLFSSERLSHAEPGAIRRIVDDFDPALVHVAVTLRPLARILPSQWQQAVQSGTTTSLDDWLRRALSEPDFDPGSLWYRHRHDRLLERWAAIVGPARVTAIVLAEGDRSWLLRVFEDLLGLRAGTLQLHRDLSNRSLTRAEVEAVRALNVALRAEGFTRDFHRNVVELGASFRIRLRDPEPDEPPIRLPTWAAEPVAAIARDIVRGIRTSGIAVVGELEALAPQAAEDEPDATEPVCLPPEAARLLVAGVLESSGVVR